MSAAIKHGGALGQRARKVNVIEHVAAPHEGRRLIPKWERLCDRLRSMHERRFGWAYRRPYFEHACRTEIKSDNP